MKKCTQEQLQNIYDTIVHAALIGIKYWRKGDEKEAKHIIGTLAYLELKQKIFPQLIGELFLEAIRKGDLPLVCVGKESSRHLLYALK